MDSVTFIEDILNRKLHFLGNAIKSGYKTGAKVSKIGTQTFVVRFINL